MQCHTTDTSSRTDVMQSFFKTTSEHFHMKTGVRDRRKNEKRCGNKGCRGRLNIVQYVVNHGTHISTIGARSFYTILNIFT